MFGKVYENKKKTINSIIEINMGYMRELATRPRLGEGWLV